MILQQIQCPLKANYPIIFFRAHSYIVGKYSLELPISQTSTFSKGIHVYLRLIDYLTDKEIGTIIHYPIPPHLSEAYRYLNIKKGSLPITEKYAETVLSLPLYNGMTEEEQEYVIESINAFS